MFQAALNVLPHPNLINVADLANRLFTEDNATQLERRMILGQVMRVLYGERSFGVLSQYCVLQQLLACVYTQSTFDSKPFEFIAPFTLASSQPVAIGTVQMVQDPGHTSSESDNKTDQPPLHQQAQTGLDPLHCPQQLVNDIIRRAAVLRGVDASVWTDEVWQLAQQAEQHKGGARAQAADRRPGVRPG